VTVFDTILWRCSILAYFLGHPVLNCYTVAWNKSLNNAFNKKMANNLTKAPIYMLVLEIVLVQLLLACALALMCTLQLHAFALRAGNWESALHIQVEHILDRGSMVQIGSSLPSSSFHPWLIGLLTVIIKMWTVAQILTSKTLLLRCWSKVSLVWNSLHVPSRLWEQAHSDEVKHHWLHFGQS